MSSLTLLRDSSKKPHPALYNYNYIATTFGFAQKNSNNIGDRYNSTAQLLCCSEDVSLQYTYGHWKSIQKCCEGLDKHVWGPILHNTLTDWLRTRIFIRSPEEVGVLTVSSYHVVSVFKLEHISTLHIDSWNPKRNHGSFMLHDCEIQCFRKSI